MNIAVNAPAIYLPGINDIIRLFYPGCDIKPGAPDADASIMLTLSVDISGADIRLIARMRSGARENIHSEKARVTPETDAGNQAKRLARLAVYRLFTQHCNTEAPSPWGILTGIRPTKLVHRLLDNGISIDDVRSILINDYALTPAKASLVSTVAMHQRLFLPGKPGAGRETGIYIGIPFCPSRCLYCSFPVYPRQKYIQWIGPYVDALLKEIRAVADLLEEYSFKASCIYLGGGTPTCLEPLQLDSLLKTVNAVLRPTRAIEFTVEGGRPETLTREIIDICRGAGVNRLSINPQTMQNRTLRVIGRNHQVQDVYLAMDQARLAGIETINMDLIAGLPGETVEDMRDTLYKIAELQPENLSVHTLAVKKASQLKRELNQHPMPSTRDTALMVQEALDRTGKLGMLPYYLYRQKNMLGNLENIGYSLPGHECLYNILIMEERNTIIGLGAGAGSKYLMPDGLLINRYNPRDPWQYIERINEVIEKKRQNLASLKKT